MGVVMYYAAVLKIDGKISVGDITAFLLYMIQLIANFVIVSLVIGNVSKMVGASEKIISLMQYMPKIHTNGGTTIPEENVVGEVELQNITFSYPSKPDVLVCNDISLKVARNKVIALVGESGCGKSSLISLI
jgi:ATP-binding cassette, subfamily B, bacterial